MIYGNITNCSVVGHGTISAYECRLGYEVISANTSTNTREVKLQLEARTINSKYTTSGWQLTPTIDGVTLSNVSINLVTANVWQVLGTRTITITGAFNGVKSGSFTTNLAAEWGLKSGSASVTINLDNLHTPPAITTIATSEKNTLLEGYWGIAQHLSVKNITFETTTYDEATISSYQVHHNGVLIGSSTSNGMTLNFSDVGTLATFEMDGKTWCTLKFVVIDSFGTTGSSEMQFEVIKYTKPNLVRTSSDIKRNGQITGKVKLNLIGTFFNQSVNDIANTISLKFTYWKKGDQEPTTYYDIPFEATDNNIELWEWYVEINGEEITDVSKDFAYNFKIKATDHFNKTSEITLLCPVGEYLWAEFKDRVDFKNITIQGTDRFEYSEEEKAIGTWIDGKPLYRKTIVGTSKLPAGYSTINHNVSNIGTHRVIKDVEFQANGNSWGNTYGNATSFVSSDSITTTAIGFDVGTNWANMFTPTVTIEYTKTTD